VDDPRVPLLRDGADVPLGATPRVLPSVREVPPTAGALEPVRGADPEL
jgi:hypothetical protein